MDAKEYNKKLSEIELEYEQKLHNLREKFVQDNAEFKIGDFIYNVTGIIKVDKIGYQIFRDFPEIVYYGYRYKKNKGVISRTKDNDISSLKYNLKILK